MCIQHTVNKTYTVINSRRTLVSRSPYTHIYIYEYIYILMNNVRKCKNTYDILSRYGQTYIICTAALGTLSNGLTTSRLVHHQVRFVYKYGVISTRMWRVAEQSIQS